MKKLARDDLKRFLDRLASIASLVAPVREDGVVLFRQVTAGEQVVMDYLNTARSPKEFFFPQTEVMFRFLTSPGASLVAASAPPETILFGIRPCDLGALACLDAVFLGGDYQDSYYRARREATTLVAVGCPEPDPLTCFCAAFGLTPGSGEGADLMLYPGPDGLAVEALTPRGEALLEKAEVPLGEAGAEGDELKRQYRSRPVPLGEVLKPEDLWKDLDARFEDPYWQEASQRCLGCGICTYLCPTCHCFLVTDEMKKEDGVRLRVWDSCQFPDFLLMAGGHNPRPTKKERVRQRFLHKLNYFVHRFGRYLCTGCGRCVAHCPVGLDMATVLAELREVTAHVG